MCFNKNPLLAMSYNLIYKPCEFSCISTPTNEPENEKYGAFEFTVNNANVKFRVAKTTPTKVGQFVTLWKRIGKGPILPYDANDPFDLYVVCVQEGQNVGQFVFPKKILALQDILSKSGNGGKRAFRVYAPWVTTENAQASRTKAWQTRYFIELTYPNNVDLVLAKKLYNILE